MVVILSFIIAVGIILAVPAVIAVIIIACVKSPKNNKQADNGYSIDGVNNFQPKPKREKLSASAIMLLIGTAFIILAAITFVTANWVKMNPAGRVSVLLSEAALAFGISALMKKVIKLNRTSMAFYMTGTIIAVISLNMAGYYKLLGEWFAVGGGGSALLFCASALAVSAASFLAYPLYKNKSFNYIGTSFVSLAVVSLCVQLTYDYEQFAPVIAFAQLIITAIIHFLKPQKNTEMEKPVVLIGDISAVIYEVMAGLYVLASTFSPTACTFLILATVLVQLLVYGIFKNQKWMFIFFNIIGIYTGFTLSCLLGDKMAAGNAELIFAFITLAFYIINRFIPKNMTANHVVTLIAVLMGSVISLLAGNDGYCLVNLIVPAAASLAVISYALNEDISVQTAAGIFSPVLPFFMGLFLDSRLNKSDISEIDVIIYGILAFVYIAVSAFFIFLPHINFNFYAKHPVKSQAVIYADMICAAGVIFNIAEIPQLFMIPVILCILHFIVSYRMSCNITAVGSVAGIVILAESIIESYIGEDTDEGMYIMFGLFVLLIIISRIVFPDGFSVKKENRTLIDVILLSSWIAVVRFPFFDRVSFFLRTIALAVFLAGFIKRKTDKEKTAVILSVSSALACFAFITRPFLTPDSSMIASKINLAIFALLGIAYRYIWKNHPSASKTVSTLIFIISFAGLIIDGLIFNNAGNRIFVLAVTAGILVLSFFVKSKTWFIASSAALVIITVFSTIRYFDSAGWWIYLLVVGVVFIAIASVNEVCKSKGETMKSTITKKFSDWTW